MKSSDMFTVAVVALVTALGVLLLGGLGMAGAGMMGVGMMGGLGFGMPIMGGLFMVGLPILFIAGLIWLVSTATRGNGAQLQTGSTQLAPQAPLDILKARYARGEINKQQFDEMRQHLAE